MAEIMKLSDWEALPMKEREAIMEAGAKLSKDPTDAMTLEEMRSRDTDNINLSVYNNLKEFRGDSLNDAWGFIRERQRVVMGKFGITALDTLEAKIRRKGKGFRPGSNEFLGKLLDTEMRKRGVKSEYRSPQMYKRNNPDDIWKAGFYFYKENEIGFFISCPMQMKYRRNNIEIPGRTEFVVLTNVPAPGKGGA